MGRLDGKTALVTGASRGIGEHCARALAADGARVALAARDEGLLRSVAAELDHDPVVIAADLMTDGAGTALAERAIEELGGVDIVVNNAGTGEIPGDDAAVLRLNYLTPLDTTTALIDSMSARGGGSVIHMSSIAGMTGVAELPTYGATKAALDSLTRSQAGKYGYKNIRVNAVAPGLIATDMWEAGRQIPGLADGLEKHIALGRWGTAEEIAPTVVFLASDDARYITGQTIVVDGGFHGLAAWRNFM